MDIYVGKVICTRRVLSGKQLYRRKLARDRQISAFFVFVANLIFAVAFGVAPVHPFIYFFRHAQFISYSFKSTHAVSAHLQPAQDGVFVSLEILINVFFKCLFPKHDPLSGLAINGTSKELKS